MIQWYKNLPAKEGVARDPGSIPGSGRYPGEGNGNSLQHSCLENLMERGTCLATAHRVSESEQLNTHTQLDMMKPKVMTNDTGWLYTTNLLSLIESTVDPWTTDSYRGLLICEFFFNSKYCGITQSVIGWIQGYRRTMDMEDQLEIICRFPLYGGPASLSLVIQGSIVHVTHVGSSKENECATYWVSEWSHSVVSNSLWPHGL